jgi:hypothetical protein
MSTGRTISIGGASTSRRWTFGASIAVHVVALGWGALTFAARQLPSDTTPMPIDIITVSEFTELTAGSRNAPKAQPAPPVADQIGARKPADDPAAKVAKTEVHAATDVPPPVPEPKPPTPEKKQSEPQRDLIAEAIKKDAAKPEPKKVEQKSEPKKAEPKPEKKAEAKPEQKSEPKTQPKKEQPKLDPRQIQALLAPDASSNQLSLSEIDAFRRHLRNCWNPPAGAPTNKRIVVPITIRLKMDRTLAAQPEVEMRASDPYSLAMIESARRAIIACQPYTMFSLPKYEIWKELSIDFDPFEMFGG